MTSLTHTRAVRRAEERGPSGPVLLVSVYRAEHAPVIQPLVDDALGRGWTVRLWALDRVAPGLEAVTVGSGPGAKCLLVNGLFAGPSVDDAPSGVSVSGISGSGPWAWVVVMDDDFVVKRGSVAALLALGERGRLDLLQPAHTERSYLTFPITRRRAFSVARRTTFVEGGPAFAVRGPWVDRVLPYPDRFEMGFGIELVWEELARDGARLGIVDAVPVRHIRPVGGGGYVKSEEMGRLFEELARRGVDSIDRVQRVIGRWRPWRSDPPWPAS
jgi:hypothetical protein